MLKRKAVTKKYHMFNTRKDVCTLGAKKRFMLRVLCLVLAITTVLAGCSKGSNEGGSTSTPSGQNNQAGTQQPQGQEAEGAFDKKLKIQWFGFNEQGYLPVDGTPIQRKLEELYNIEIENVKVDTYNQEQVNVYLASGDPADFYYLSNPPELMYNSGMIRDIPIDMLETYAPAILDSLDQVERDIWSEHVTFDGKLYGIPAFSATTLVALSLGVRKDWMDNVGVTKIPETLDELEELFVKIRHEDPDNNGKKDTYALSKFQSTSEAYSTVAPYVFGAYGVKGGHWNLLDGDLVWWAVHPQYKEALKKLADWYKKEIFDPEVALDDRTSFMTKFENGQLAGFFEWDSWHDPGLESGPVGRMLSKNPGAEMVYIPPVKGPDGHYGSTNSPPISRTVTTYFGANTSDEKMIRLLQMLNDIYSDKDLYALVDFGFEGEDYTINEKGQYVPMPDRFTQEAITERGARRYMMRNFMNDVAMQFRLTPSRLEMREHIVDFAIVDAPDYQPAFPVETAAALTKIEQEFFWKAFVGQISDIDKEWDSYVSQWNAAGGKAATDMANEGYQKFK